jgi:hypothetical protein
MAILHTYLHEDVENENNTMIYVEERVQLAYKGKELSHPYFCGDGYALDFGGRQRREGVTPSTEHEDLLWAQEE